MREYIAPFISAFIVVFLIVTVPAFAQEKYPVGKVIAVEGEVKFTSGSGNAAAKPDDPVYMYNTVSTGPASKILILLIDDTQITLGENSELTIDEFVFDPYDSNENKARVSFPRGVFQWVSGMITKRKAPDVILKTGYGAVGIRGTIVWGGDTDGGYGVYVQEGEALVQTDLGSLLVPQGTGTLIPSKKAKPLPVNAWRPERLDRAKLAITLQNRSRIAALMGNEMVRNIERRHEYRKIMWPWKPGVYVPPADDIKDNRSREFKNLPEQHRQRMRQHEDRIRNGVGKE